MDLLLVRGAYGLWVDKPCLTNIHILFGRETNITHNSVFELVNSPIIFFYFFSYAQGSKFIPYLLSHGDSQRITTYHYCYTDAASCSCGGSTTYTAVSDSGCRQYIVSPPGVTMTCPSDLIFDTMSCVCNFPDFTTCPSDCQGEQTITAM